MMLLLLQAMCYGQSKSWAPDGLSLLNRWTLDTGHEAVSASRVNLGRCQQRLRLARSISGERTQRQDDLNLGNPRGLLDLANRSGSPDASRDSSSNARPAKFRQLERWAQDQHMTQDTNAELGK